MTDTSAGSTTDPSDHPSDNPSDSPSADPSADPADDFSEGPSTEDLVGDWLTVPDVAERLGIPLSSVRRMIEERELLSARVGERRVVAVPAAFLDDAVLPHLRGTFTVLSDGGLRDDEILRWLFTVDQTLRVPGTPVDNLRAGFKTEVRRRAMEQAF